MEELTDQALQLRPTLPGNKASLGNKFTFQQQR